MKRVITIFFLTFSFLSYSQNELCTIRRDGENVHITTRIDDTHKINYWFKKCMANNLFTFYMVSLCTDTDSVILNESTSDNIGPFEIQDGGWCGGNHLFLDNKTKTAETVFIKIFADNKLIESDTIINAHEICFDVTNNIFNPASSIKMQNDIKSFSDTLCIEKVIYRVSGNSVTVNVSHEYINRIPIVISKYYGMQSMFIGENCILTPMGKYSSWTAIDKIGRFKKKDYQQFNHFIEKSQFGYQSSYLLNNDLGNHHEISDNDIIFIGNSWSKSYHKLISNSSRVAGDSDTWSGVYTWFTKPLLDTNLAFSYNSVINGELAIVFSNKKRGCFSIALNQIYRNKKMLVFENNSEMIVTQKEDSLFFNCGKAGSAIITFSK